MNHIYRTVWNEAQQAWVAVAEIVGGRGKTHSIHAGPAPEESNTGPSLPLVVISVALCLLGSSAWSLDTNALPTGGKIMAGSAAISQSGNTLTVQQNTNRAALDWQSFNIGQGAAVSFVQPSSSSVALNRILGNEASQIYGRLNANGQVFFSNPNGMLFGAGSQVNVGSLLATTMAMDPLQFMTGNLSLTNPGAGSIRNEGLIFATGSVVLAANTVENAGQIITTNVSLAAGDSVAVDLTSDGLIRARVTDPSLHASLRNSGSIEATQAVMMTAGQAKGVMDRVVNNSGVIRATGLSVQNGEILLEGGMVSNSGTLKAGGTGGGGSIKLLGDMAVGAVGVGGTLDVSGSSGTSGGFIETSAAHVRISSELNVPTNAGKGRAGTWLIDPVDFTVAPVGGDVTGTALTSMLDANNVTIQTATGTNSTSNLYGTVGSSGDIFVNDTVSWSAHTLTLNAYRNININAPMNGSGTAGLALQYGQGAVAAGNAAAYKINAPVSLASTGTFSTKLGSDGANISYTIITSLGAQGSSTGTDLQGINGNLAGNYAIGANIDASSTSTWSGGGFSPIGGNSAPGFSGQFDGLGHTIGGLYISHTGLSNVAYSDNVGLFGWVGGSTIRNLGLVNVNMTGDGEVGGIAAVLSESRLFNTYVTGTIVGVGPRAVGGLVGEMGAGSSAATVSIESSYSTATISASGVNIYQKGIGGLVGSVGGWNPSVTNSYATGTVTVTGAGICASYSTLTCFFAGGLVGNFAGMNANVNNSYATGPVSATTAGSTNINYIGGLVGYNGDPQTSSANVTAITNSYASGPISVSGGTNFVGGLSGYTKVASGGSATITNVYASGQISASTGSNTIGGLVANGIAAATSFGGVYYDSTINPLSNLDSTYGRSTAQLQAASTFTSAGWSFPTTWKIVEGATYPYLAGFPNRWNIATSGNWSTGNNWSLGHVPITGESVALDNLGTAYTVTVSSGNWSAGNINAQNALTLSGGTLTLDDPTAFSRLDTLNITSGTLTLNGSSVIDRKSTRLNSSH